MCGRYVLATSLPEVAEAFGASCSPEIGSGYRPSWNIAPQRTVIGVVSEARGRVLRTFRWGLVPAWSAPSAAGSRTFNARAETIATKPSFRAAFRSRRVIVPADGFYEWSRSPGDERQPYLFRRADGGLLALAGLWEVWRPSASSGDDDALVTCTLVTAPAGPDVADVHDRQPVVLDRDAWDAWLDPDLRDRESLEALLHASPPRTLARHAVGRAVGRTGVDGPALAEALVEP
ncbi:MAG: SOS response-associated peptidase [Actinomycetota bacterium]|nr:SOS response-associated peptidase [Actinomycetota bacterium]